MLLSALNSAAHHLGVLRKMVRAMRCTPHARAAAAEAHGAAAAPHAALYCNLSHPCLLRFRPLQGIASDAAKTRLHLVLPRLLADEMAPGAPAHAAAPAPATTRVAGAHVTSGGWLDVNGGSRSLAPGGVLSLLAGLCRTAPSDAPATLLLCDDISALSALCASSAASIPLLRGLAALGTPRRCAAPHSPLAAAGEPPPAAAAAVSVMLRVTPDADAALRCHPTFTAVLPCQLLLSLCDTVATFRPLAASSGRSRDVLGRLLIAERLASGARGGDGGGGWLAPPPRSSLYRIAEASCRLVGVGSVTVAATFFNDEAE